MWIRCTQQILDFGFTTEDGGIRFALTYLCTHSVDVFNCMYSVERNMVWLDPDNIPYINFNQPGVYPILRAISVVFGDRGSGNSLAA
jgi:hypothetical protein